MSDDVDALKKNRIDPKVDRTHLPTMDAPPVTDLAMGDEAFGGSGEAPAEPVDEAALRERIVEVLRDIYDPEIPVNIYELGLIYGFEIEEGGKVEIRMTLTAPACPVAGALVGDVARRVGEVDGVSTSHVKLVWDPPWTMDRMTEEARLELGLL